MDVHCFGICDQSAQEYNQSYLADRVLRFCHRHHNNDNSVACSQSGGHTEGSLLPSRIGDSTDEDSSLFHRHLSSHQASSFSGSSSLSRPTRPERPGSPPAADIISVMGAAVLGSQNRFAVVEDSTSQSPLHTILEPEAFIMIETNASKQGWGGVCKGMRTGGKWTVTESQHHVNYLELKAAFLALQSFVRDKSNVCILIRMDNRTAITYVNKLGGLRLSHLCRLALELWDWCQIRKITPHTEYLPGKENCRADWESRHHQDNSDWQLSPVIFSVLYSLLGPFNVDLFASRTNTHLHVYYSWKPDPAAKTVDAFSVSWAQDRPYLFPSFSMIGKALTKIHLERVEYACLIAPAWPG